MHAQEHLPRPSWVVKTEAGCSLQGYSLPHQAASHRVSGSPSEQPTARSKQQTHPRKQPSHSIGPSIQQEFGKSWSVHPEPQRNSKHLSGMTHRESSRPLAQPKALGPPQGSSIPIDRCLACPRILHGGIKCNTVDPSYNLHTHTQANELHGARLKIISQRCMILFDRLASFCSEFYMHEGGQQQPGGRPQRCWFGAGRIEGSHVKVDLENLT